MDLNELTLENVGVWPLPIKATVIGFACAIILALGYWFILKPQFRDLSQAKKQEVDLRVTFEAKNGQASNLNVYKRQVVEVRKLLSSMLYQLPQKSEVPNLIEDISKVGIASGLEFKLIKPEEQVKHDFYAELPIEISVMGNYHQMAEFVSSIANLQRIVNVEDFSIEKTPAPTAATSPNGPKPESLPSLTMKMIAKTYHYVPAGSEGLSKKEPITVVSEPKK